MRIDRTWIAAHIPHQGSMCLLDEVLEWDDTRISCVAHSQHLADNPLRAAHRLGIANGIEYAAQAMSVHGALLAGADEAPRAGYLASVREVEWHTQEFGASTLPLRVEAQRLSGNATTILYNFALYEADTLLISGRASVVMDADRI